MASKELLNSFPVDAYDMLALPQAQFPSYAITIDFSLFPTTEPELPSDFQESELEIIAKKLNDGSPLTKRERQIWDYFDRGVVEYTDKS